MKLKKILASLTAAAMAVTTMAFAPVSVSAASYMDFGSSNGSWTQGTFVSSSSAEMSGVDVSEVTSVKFNAVAYDINWGWNNGKFTVDGSSWNEYSFGGVNENAPDGTYDLTLDTSKLFTATMDFAVKPDNTWAVGWGTGTNEGAGFAIGSIEFYEGNSKIGTWADNEWFDSSDDVYLFYNFGSSNSSWTQGTFVSSSSAEMSGIDVSEVTSVKFNAVAYDINWGWNNGKFTVDGSSWNEYSFGGVNENAPDGTYDLTLDTSKLFTATMDFAVKPDNTWAVGWGTGTNEGAGFAVFSIDFLAGSELVGTWTNGYWLGTEVPVDSVTITPATLDLTVDGEETLTATVLPDNATDKTVEWSSSNEDVATVDENGKVTAIAEGTATITAAAGEQTAECEVTVSAKTYPITVTTNDETMGTASAKVAEGTASAKVTEAKEDELVTLIPVAKIGYKFVEWVAPEGVTISKDNTFVMPAKAVTVQAVFAVKEADEFDIVIDNNIENGTVAVTGGATAAKAGNTVTLSITPDMGCEFVSLTVNGEAIEGNSFTMPAEDVAISAVFKKIDYKITIKPDECGTITVDKETAQYGDTVTVTVTPNEGYIVHAVYVNGEAIEGTTFKMPAEDVEIFVGYETKGSIETEGGTSPSGITISFEDNNDAVLEAVFGEGWADRYAISDNLSVKMEVLDEVPAEDKTAVENYLSDNQYLGVILDITLIKTVNDTSTEVTECSKPISFRIDVPDDIIAEDRIYSVVRVHDGKAENIGGTFDSESKTITVSSDKFSTYAIVYDEASVEEPVPEPDVEPVVYYSITSDRNVRTSLSSASAGTTVTVDVDFGYDAIVYCGGTRIARITDRGTFVMPAGSVRIVTEANGYLAMIKKAAPNSYIFVYDSEMNHIKTNGSRKGIVGEGTITVKLGEEYAGMTVTLYKGRKSTAVELDSAVLDADGNATFTVEGGKNYTAVVE